MKVDPLINIARAVSCPVRLELLRLLGPHGRGVTDVAREMGIAPSTAAFHIAVLVRARLAVRRGKGARRPTYSWGSLRCSLSFTDATAARRPAFSGALATRPPARAT